MTGIEIVWRDAGEVAVRDGDTVRRFSYVRRGNELLLTDGKASWTLSIASSGTGLRAGPGLAESYFGDGLKTQSGQARSPVPPSISGRVTSQMPGKVLDVRVAQGDNVAAGDVLLVLEAMKMEHAISAPCAGTVTHLTLTPGQRVMPGDLLAEIEPML